MYKAIVIALTLFVTLLMGNAARANDVATTTVPVAIDGITRTVTIAISGTDVLSVTVAPISDTFQTTATEWLDELIDIVREAALGATINITSTEIALNELLTKTITVDYPAYYTPFVRQYRFAIHRCRAFLEFHAGPMAAGKDSGGAFLVGAYYALQTTCLTQHSAAYVEMERIAHPVR